MELKTFFLVTAKFNNKESIPSVNELAVNEFMVDGIEEFSMEENEVDKILGERAYSGGDIPIDLISEVEERSREEESFFKYYFFTGDIQRSLKFTDYLKENDLFFEVEEKEYSDWNEEWKKHYRPILVGDELEVVPEWFKEGDYKNKDNKVYINPGMGFGTGEHETTYLCLKLLLEVKEYIKSKDLCLDFGCGSGILGIAAIKKRDTYVDFVDIDPAALDNCLENLKLNFFENKLNGHRLVHRSRFYKDEKYKLIFANILKHVLEEEKEVFVKALDKEGYLILSGILNNQVEDIINFYQEFDVINVISKKDWSAILMKMK